MWYKCHCVIGGNPEEWNAILLMSTYLLARQLSMIAKIREVSPQPPITFRQRKESMALKWLPPPFTPDLGKNIALPISLLLLMATHSAMCHVVLFIPILRSPFTYYSLQRQIQSYQYEIITLMMTACAGRLTPQASVAVHTRHLMKPSEKYFSTKFLSCLNIPAWCIPSL